jgi:hypothetical protein
MGPTTVGRISKNEKFLTIEKRMNNFKGILALKTWIPKCKGV